VVRGSILVMGLNAGKQSVAELKQVVLALAEKNEAINHGGTVVSHTVTESPKSCAGAGKGSLGRRRRSSKIVQKSNGTFFFFPQVCLNHCGDEKCQTVECRFVRWSVPNCPSERVKLSRSQT
jgi:hypothetical protein